MDKNWMGFKSGTDIRGIGFGDCTDPLYLSDDAVKRMAKGFVLWLYEKTAKTKLTVSVGHDSRVSSQRIDDAVTEALVSMGVDVIRCSMSSTPAMFMTTVDLPCDGAIQITASHHPMDKNGLKFFTKDGGLDSSDIEYILDKAQRNEFESAEGGSCRDVNFMETYAASLRELIKKEVRADNYDRPLAGYKIAVDAGNGVGGFYATQVLEKLGADISGSRFLEPDGTFPNHIANPEDKTAMKMASEATLESNSDLGVIFDTDVDRAGCVGKDGQEINRNRLIALASCIALEGNEGGTVVTDSVTSDGLCEFIKQLGGKHLRFKRGYKNVINKMAELNADGINCPLAIETSGHAAFRDNYNLDDGAYLVTKIIIRMALLGKEGKNIEDMLSALRIPAEEKEIRYRILCDDFKTAGNRFIEEWTEYASRLDGYTSAPDNYEGIRFSTDKNSGNGWILVRLSVHDPVIAINAESDSQGGCRQMFKVLYDFSKNKESLDISKLSQYLD
ncbi:MAG: phosphomannomutase/phosphoglucomutase [Clostridia bacterium]|nr:phosphomannomutase/phosphoglucomutase [Clostridia bacterium]